MTTTTTTTTTTTRRRSSRSSRRRRKDAQPDAPLSLADKLALTAAARRRRERREKKARGPAPFLDLSSRPAPPGPVPDRPVPDLSWTFPGPFRQAALRALLPRRRAPRLSGRAAACGGVRRPRLRLNCARRPPPPRRVVASVGRGARPPSLPERSTARAQQRRRRRHVRRHAARLRRLERADRRGERRSTLPS